MVCGKLRLKVSFMEIICRHSDDVYMTGTSSALFAGATDRHFMY